MRVEIGATTKRDPREGKNRLSALDKIETNRQTLKLLEILTELKMSLSSTNALLVS